MTVGNAAPGARERGESHPSETTERNASPEARGRRSGEAPEKLLVEQKNPHRGVAPVA